MRSLQVTLVILALLACSAALLLQDAPAVIWRHVLFGMGVLPLILGAMLYFIPVLTRTSPAEGAVLLVPIGAFLLGFGTVINFRFAPDLIPLAAGLVLVLVVLEFTWAWRRRAQVLGSAHPGVGWYLAALVALMLALSLVVSRIVWPEGWMLTRAMHLHLNLFGFLGLTAISTLRVLLPTVLGEQGTSAYVFLRRQLPSVVSGTIAITIGAAYWPALAVLGALLWMWSGMSMLRDLWRYKQSWWSIRGAGISLGGAAIGWVLVLCAGIAHGVGVVSADAVMAWLLYLFLLPLVTGASSYLLPVWRWPGRQSTAHTHMRERLMAFSGARILAFWVSAGLVATDIPAAPLPAVLALLSYLLQVLFAFLRVRQSAI
jgi:hypothetical protein